MAPLLILFGLSAPPDAADGLASMLARREQAVVRVLGRQGFEVRLPPEGFERPEPGATRDLAGALGAARVVVMDYEPATDAVWISHYLRGLEGPWDVRAVECRRHGDRPVDCPGLELDVLSGLRPRTDLDVDVGGALRSLSVPLARCLRGQRGGALVVELVFEPEAGRARAAAIAPARVARSEVGDCLRASFARASVGPFEGPPIRLRVPIAP